jgi:hypothetical protein
MGRARCESYKSIDVRRWQRQGLLSPGTFFSQTWTRDGEPSGNIGVPPSIPALRLRPSSSSRSADIDHCCAAHAADSPLTGVM